MNQGTRIAVLRQVRGLSQGELAQMCIMCQSAISYIETGARDVTAGQLADIRTALGWTVDVSIALDRLEDAAEATDGE